MPDDIEFAIGSDPNNIDSNNDGIDEFESIQKQIDPIPSYLRKSPPKQFNSQSSTINSPFTAFPSVIIPTPEITSPPPIPEVTNPQLTAAAQELMESAIALWNQQLIPPVEFDVDLTITDLPLGQLAEARLTRFDNNGLPVGGTILIDHNANGLGWFIDETPFKAEEFEQSLNDWTFQATDNSNAFGEYDLLTSLLHELAHIAGFIEGYTGFDRQIQTIEGSQLFVGSDFTASIVGDHLNPAIHSHDLLSPTLSTSQRRLPSPLDLQILSEIRQYSHGSINLTEALTAVLMSHELLNGNFDITDPNDPDFGWSTRGSMDFSNNQATFNEGNQFNTRLSQTFTIPDGATTLQFTILDTNLNISPLVPNDTFEVALLDANTMTSLLDTAEGLPQTDAFLNIQADGSIFFGSQVIVPNLVNSGDTIDLDNPLVINVDISNIAGGTSATLFFDLLGFGNIDAQVIVDNVSILSTPLTPPTANDDQGTTTEENTIKIDVLANDSDNGTLAPATVIISNNPANGTVVVNDDGTINYTPNLNFSGTDSFTYTVRDNEGATSNVATVNLTINPVNDGPIANDETIRTDENTAITIPVLDNDSDVDGNLDINSIAHRKAARALARLRRPLRDRLSTDKRKCGN